MKLDDSMKLKILGVAMAVSLAAATRWTLRKGWVAGTGDEPPDNPAEDGVSWRRALVWGAASGATAGVARTLGRRLASSVHHRG